MEKKLEKLARLKQGLDKGYITEEEYKEWKEKILKKRR